MHRLTQPAAFLLLAFLFTACRSTESATPSPEPSPSAHTQITAADTPRAVPLTESPATLAYPGPQELATSAYPAPESGYPAPPDDVNLGQLGPAFSIDMPLVVGATSVSGTGPAGVPVKVIDITFLGETLGTGTIDSDGTFDIQLRAPLASGHSIGLQIGALEGTSYSYEDFLRGPGYQDIPMIGTIFAQAVVVDQ